MKRIELKRDLCSLVTAMPHKMWKQKKEQSEGGLLVGPFLTYILVDYGIIPEHKKGYVQ